MVLNEKKKKLTKKKFAINGLKPEWFCSENNFNTLKEMVTTQPGSTYRTVLH